MGRGTFIWEPTQYGQPLFDTSGSKFVTNAKHGRVSEAGEILWAARPLRNVPLNQVVATDMAEAGRRGVAMNVKAGFAREISLLFVLGIASLAAAADCGGLSPSGTTTGSGGSQAPATGGSSGRGASGTTGSTGGTPGTGGGSSATGGVSATGGSTGRAGTSGATGGAGGGTMGTGGAAGGTMGTGGLGAAGSGGIGAGGAPGMCSKSMATFNDITSNHAVPAWLKNANYAIGMHFGPYSVGAHHTEWDSRNMYCNSAIRQWYIDHFGSNGTVGYKDSIAKMTLPNFDPASWAAVFKKAKASIVFGSAEHHYYFAMWNSPHTKWCIAKTAGRDVIGELAASVRAQGMKFGVLDHILYGYSFYWCGANADKTVDIYDPQYYDLYGDFGGWDSHRGQAHTRAAALPTAAAVHRWQLPGGTTEPGIHERMADPGQGADRSVPAGHPLVRLGRRRRNASDQADFRQLLLQLGVRLGEGGRHRRQGRRLPG